MEQYLKREIISKSKEVLKINRTAIRLIAGMHCKTQNIGLFRINDGEQKGYLQSMNLFEIKNQPIFKFESLREQAINDPIDPPKISEEFN